MSKNENFKEKKLVEKNNPSDFNDDDELDENLLEKKLNSIDLDQEDFFKIIRNFRNLEDIKNYVKILHKGLIRLRLILLISETDERNKIIDEFSSNFKITKMDDLYKIELKDDVYPRTKAILRFLGYLWFFPDNLSFILFTFSTKKNIIRHFFTSFINKSRNISPLWVNQETTFKLITYLKSNFNAVIKKWKGEYSPVNNKKSKIRPFIERTIVYMGNDAYESLLELNQLYGVNIEDFTATLFDLGYFSFNRKVSTLLFRQGNLDTFINLSKWIFENSEKYMNQIRKFKKSQFYSIFSKRLFTISNDLAINFNEQLSNEILNEIVKRIKNSDNLKLNFAVDFAQDNNIVYDLKIINDNSKSSFKVIISKNSAHIFQIYNANFIGAIPILDIIDFCQPRNEILVQVP